jgi:hypothetical protein
VTPPFPDLFPNWQIILLDFLDVLLQCPCRHLLCDPDDPWWPFARPAPCLLLPGPNVPISVRPVVKKRDDVDVLDFEQRLESMMVGWVAPC